MNNYMLSAFRSHPIFEGISSEDCMIMMNCLGCTEKSYKKDQIISAPEVYGRLIGVVTSGCIHTIKEDIWGRHAFLSYTGPDGIFGEVMIGEQFRDRGVIFKAAEPSTVLYIPAEKVLHPCKKNCPFHLQLSRNLFNLMSLKNIALTEKIEITSKSSLRDKILAYLSLEAQKCGSMTVTLPLNRTEMADYLCTNRSALSRELSNMKKDGILDYDQRVFHLHSGNEQR